MAFTQASLGAIGKDAMTVAAGGYDADIAASGDDGHVGWGANTTTWDSSTSGTLIAATASASGGLYIGLRFINVTVAQGATISSATLTLTQSDASGVAVGSLWYGWDTDNAAQFSDATDTPNTATRTTASSQIQSHGGAAYLEVTHDVTSIVQEIINRGGWSSGNALTLMGIAVTPTTLFARSFDNGSGIPNLTITV